LRVNLNFNSVLIHRTTRLGHLELILFQQFIHALSIE
jgi:hypothetical protein